MTFRVTHQSNADGAQSPFRIVETQTGREVEWLNRFLDRECVRCLAETTLRGYAMDLLHFVRWWASVNHADTIAENALASDCPTICVSRRGSDSALHPRPSIAG
jgi:hypothetical protein